jgi:hypothetical protein
MIITRRSPLTGKLNEMDLPITEDQIRLYQQGGYWSSRRSRILARINGNFSKPDIRRRIGRECSPRRRNNPSHGRGIGSCHNQSRRN